MAQFYGQVKGQRGEASRLGSKASGISAHIRGWNVGARVECAHVDGKDVVRVYRTSGSNGGGSDVLLQEFSE